MTAGSEEESRIYKELSCMDAEELFAWALREHGSRAGIITSFQDTGCVMIDMMHKVAPGMRVLTVDTLRLHPESYALMEEINSRYGISVERFQPDAERLSRMVAQHGEYLFFDTKAKQEYCCTIRKTEPNDKALETLNVWFTGLRRDQSAFRNDTPRVRFIHNQGRSILKIAPLVNWDQQQVDEYMHANGVPRSALYDMGYTSIGCMICSTPTLPTEDKRAGRWRWFNYLDEDQKECGIHIGGSGI
jgi:phosphoadenylyl-sulfate reductase (thioredoxin)